MWKEQPLEWLLFPLARKNYFDEKPQAGKESKPCATVAESEDGSPCAMMAQSIFKSLVPWRQKVRMGALCHGDRKYG